MITYHFHISNNPIAKAIRLYSEYSHVSIEFMGYVYEAVMLDEDTGRRGVIKTPVELFDGSNIVKGERIDVLYPREVHAFLEAQVGKSYDYLGVLSFLWRFLPHNIGAWFCSELATVSLAKARGVEVYNQKQTPEDFYKTLQWVK
jgi:hypothetical protein